MLDYPEIHVVGGGAFYGVAIDGGFLQDRRKQLLEHGRKSLKELIAQVELKSLPISCISILGHPTCKRFNSLSESTLD